MQGREVFEYAIIRFVPKVEREEFVNVGVVLSCKRKNYLGVKYHVDEEKLKALDPAVDLVDISNYLKSWVSICAGSAEGGPIAKLDIASRFRWLTASRSTIIQHSPVHTGIHHDPEKVLQDIFNKYVL